MSDTSASAGSQSDSDDSSAVAVVEPTDQAAAEVPCVADLMATSNFPQHLLNDPHAPMIAVGLEEQALAPARVLARLPCLEWPRATRLRASSTPGCAPALAQTHADLATYLAAVIVDLFDPARLELLPEALADYRKLGDPNVVARALLAQINYTADVAANMSPHTCTTASDVFRFCLARAAVHHDCPPVAHGLHVPASTGCILRSPPPDTQLPTLAASYISHCVRWPTSMLGGSSSIRAYLAPRRVVHVPAPLWAAPHGSLCAAPD